MKLIGHVFVAVEAFPDRNQNLLAFGSLLPETVSYTKNPALAFEQIHEGCFELYKFCKQNYPEFVDLSIGTMAHSVKFGADSYNTHEEIARLGYTQDDLPKIAEALEVSLDRAKGAAHNLYDLALDYYIYQRHPEVKGIIENTKTLDKTKIAKILAECYLASEPAINDNLDHLWDKYNLSLMESFEGLAKFWKLLVSGTKHDDPVNVPKTAALLEFFYNKLEPEAESFVEDVIESTKIRVSGAI